MLVMLLLDSAGNFPKHLLTQEQGYSHLKWSNACVGNCSRSKKRQRGMRTKRREEKQPGW